MLDDLESCLADEANGLFELDATVATGGARDLDLPAISPALDRRLSDPDGIREVSRGEKLPY